MELTGNFYKDQNAINSIALNKIWHALAFGITLTLAKIISEYKSKASLLLIQLFQILQNPFFLDGFLLLLS